MTRAWLIAGLLCLPFAARAQSSVTCAARQRDTLVLVDVTFTDAIDERLVELVKLGLPARIEVEVAVWRERDFWFDELLATRRLEATVTTDGAETLKVDGRRTLADHTRILLERAYASLSTPPAPDARLVVTLNAELRVVTEQSLKRLARFVSTGEQTPSPFSKVVRARLATSLAKEATGRCRVTRTSR